MPGDVVYATWRECKQCSPPAKRKTPKTMTSFAISRAIIRGDVRAAVGGPAFEQAKKRENDARRSAVLRRWDAWWAARWDHARSRMRKELDATTQRIYYARDNPHREDPGGAVHAFLLEYREQVRALISWCTDMRRLRTLGREHARRLEGAVPVDGPPRRGRPAKQRPHGDRKYVMDARSQWSDFIRHQDLQHLRDVYTALPTQVRVQRLGSPPLILFEQSPDVAQCLHGYAELEDRDAQQQRVAALTPTPPASRPAGAHTPAPPAPPHPLTPRRRPVSRGRGASQAQRPDWADDL